MKKMILSMLLFGMIGGISAQGREDAFSKSYIAEKAYKYTDAIAAIKAVYDAKIYEDNLRLGYLTYLNKQYNESENYYTKAIALMPYSIEAKLGLVLPLTQLGNWTAIKTQYLEILKIDPQNTTVNYDLGYIYYNAKDYASALSYFEKAVNLYPFSYYAVLMDAWSNLKLGRYSQASILFNKVLLISPGDASAKEGLSLIKN